MTSIRAIFAILAAALLAFVGFPALVATAPEGIVTTPVPEHVTSFGPGDQRRSVMGATGCRYRCDAAGTTLRRPRESANVLYRVPVLPFNSLR